MDTSVTIANWRTAPYSSQSFHQVAGLVPTARIAAPAKARTMERRPTSLDGISVVAPSGQKRGLAEVLAATDTRGLVVLHRGNLVAEWYGNGYDGESPHIVFSVSKSLTGAMAGILVAKGQLDPNSPVTAYIPEAEGSAYGDCTVRHVLDMTVSSSFVEEYVDLSGDYGRYRRATLWEPPLAGEEPQTLHQLLARLSPAPGPHGQVFRYLSPNSDMLGWLVERAGGSDFAGLFSSLVWQPMGAEADGYVTVDAEGSPRTAGGICVLPRDLARFGEMMRLDGNGVVPAAWVEDIRNKGDRAAWLKGEFAELFPAGRYRSKWYQTGLASDAFCAIGIHGQWLWIDPAREVVIAKVSAQPDPVNDAVDYLLIRTFEAIAAAVG